MNDVTRDVTNDVTSARSIYPAAIVVFVAVRLVGLAMLAVMADAHDLSLVDRLTAWDADWYLAIAQFGYDDIPATFSDARGDFTPGVTPLVFFPLYPALVALVGSVGVHLVVAALLVNVVAGVFLACGIARLVQALGYDRQAGLVLVALCAGAPMAISLSMAFTEALFMAFAVWALAFAVQERWPLAALCCVGAGLTRSTATVLVAVVCVAALIAAWRGRRRLDAIVCLVVAPLGLLGYWAYVAFQTGSLTGWFEIQEGWLTTIDGGQATAEFVFRTFTHGPSVMEAGTALIILGSLALLGVCLVNRVSWLLVAYAAGFLATIILMSGLQAGKPRFLLPAAVALLLPVAIGLAKRRPATMIIATVGIVLLGCWFSAYALVGWRFSI